ncbi:MAG: AhpC/TSA family protein [Fimbriimonadaceae bacterium]|nr:AhpC/TSA family protein [Fimbriimonadaceae bacterium]
MKAPDALVKLSTGDEVSLASLYSDAPLALVFVRHFGCVFCRDHMRKLGPLNGLNIAFATMGNPDQAAEVKELMKSPHRFICDPDRELYHAFDVKEGKFGQIFNIHTFRKGIAAMLRGNSAAKPSSNPWQLGGTFVIDTTGEIRFAQPARDAADNVSPDELKAVMRSVVAGDFTQSSLSD